MIDVQNLHKTYGKKANAYEALRGVSLVIKKGDRVAIQGKSGSGKSTLMHLLAGLDTPTSGVITFDSKPLSGMKESGLAKLRNEKFGFIFQQFFLQPNLSVLENVTLPLKIRGVGKRQRDELGKKLLAEVKLSDKLKNRATNLSGGEKQRVAIARAMVTSPEVIFADEPTGNLDSANSESVMQLLFDMHRQRQITLVIVTHDSDIANRCDYTIHIQDGKIVQ